MPKYKYKDCRAVWYGWGIRKGLPKMWRRIKACPYKYYY